MIDLRHSSETINALARARSLLFVPGNRPERFAKALRSGADAVVLDLEDSVPPSAKQTARESMHEAWPELQANGLPLVVRINTPLEVAGITDLEWLARLPGLAGVMVSKAESIAVLGSVRENLSGVAILPLIESVAGLAALSDLAGTAGVLRLVLGHIDFMADSGIQCSDDERELNPLRFALSMSTRMHRLAPAVDGVTVSLDDDARLRQDTKRAQRFGFGGKLCIHPRQVAVIHDALLPSVEELDWARRVIAADSAAGGAAVQLDGRMVDAPVVLQARRILARIGERANS